MIKNENYNWIKGGGAIYPHIRYLYNILGENNTEKYSDILPALSLIFWDINTRYITTGNFDALFSYDSDGGASLAQKGLDLVRKAKLSQLKKEAVKLPVKPAVMLSHTFVYNSRYKTALAEIKKLCDITHTLSLSDIGALVTKKGITFTDMHYTVQPVMWEGSISGERLKALVLDAAAFLAQLIADGKNCADFPEKSDKIFFALQKEYQNRIGMLCKTLSQHKIERYITINQYNLRDVMLLDACHRLGIPTRQMEHHSSLCMHLANKPVPIYRFAYTDDYCVWGSEELFFHQNFYGYLPMFGQTVELKTVGNPETAYDTAVSDYGRYPARNRIVYMVSGIMNENDEKLYTGNIALQKRIFSQLKKLGDKTGYEVLVRFPPKINPKTMAECTPILESMGIKVSSSLPGTLMDDMCGSKIVFGTISSVISTSVIMGRKVYQIIAAGNEPLYTEKSVTPISIEDIENISDDWSAYPLPLNRSDFIDYNLLVK